jgi:hypothetical protein
LHLSESILGKHIVEKLQARGSAPVLTIGRDTFTRPQLSRIGCFNFAAAARLTHLLTELEVKDTRDLFERFGPAHLAIPGLGAICLATVGAAFEILKIGTLSDYITRHHPKGDPMVTFHTMKDHVLDAKAARDEKKTAKARRDRRNRAAHEHRVDRHVTRAGANA